MIYSVLDDEMGQTFRFEMLLNVKTLKTTRLSCNCCDQNLNDANDEAEDTSDDFNKSEFFRHNLIQDFFQFVA